MARASATEITQALSTAGWAYISLHTGDPSTTGANEVSGGTYVRVAVTWSPSVAGGPASNAGALTINIPASTTVSYFGIWSASSSGTYYVGGPLSPAITTSTSAGTVTFAIGAITVTAA